MVVDWRTVQNYLKKVVLITLSILLIALCVRFFIAEPSRVDGQSMEPNFRDNNLIVVNKLIYLLRQPKRSEIIQMINSKQPKQLLVKRIIGLPGETIVLKNKAVYLQEENNLTLLAEPYLTPHTYTEALDNQRTFMIPSNYYFVLGDNRVNSQDSREFGLVHRTQIIGKVYKASN